MAKPEQLSRRARLGMIARSMLRRKVLAGIAALVMGASLVFTGSTFAHNIDLDKAWETARDYARSVRKESEGRYLHYATSCANMFRGHNHYVRCTITFQNAKDKAAGVYTCKESIEIYWLPHTRGNSENYLFYGKHVSFNGCGRSRLLTDTRMSGR